MNARHVDKRLQGEDQKKSEKKPSTKCELLSRLTGQKEERGCLTNGEKQLLAENDMIFASR